MQDNKGREATVHARFPLTFIAAFALLNVSAFVPVGGRAQQQDARPRRADALPSLTPTPVPARDNKPPTLTEHAPVLRAAPVPPPDPAGQEVRPDELVRVDTSLVNLNVRVIDRNNRPVGDVRQEEFHVYEDGVLQSIGFFSKEEVPISYGLTVDNSGSMWLLLNHVIDAARTIIESNKPGDETFLVRFVDSDKIETLQDFTADKEALRAGLDKMFIGSGQTAVLDAVYLTAERVAQYKKSNDLSARRRRALILVTDGEDRASFYKQEQLFASLREEDVQIYVIGFVGELDRAYGFIRKSPRQKAISLLNKLARETGGRVFYPKSLSELPSIAQEITRDLRTQYVLGYSPTNKAHDGSYHTVRVTVAAGSGRDKRIALTRPGYYTPRAGHALAKTPRPRAG